jgi:Trypsin-like peptidase domain
MIVNCPVAQLPKRKVVCEGMNYQVRMSLILLACLLSPIAATSDSPAVAPNFEHITQSVFKVSADNCSNQQPGEGTGFLWKNSNQLVTALHVIAGCQAITVTGNHKTLPAKITHILKMADLALLSVSGLDSFPVLSESVSPLTTDQELWAWGYQEGGPNPSERKLYKLEGARTLGEFVSKEVANDIRVSGTPDLSMEIVYVSELVPGLSGAPILDANGTVVGIGNGGLNGGSVGVNWATPPKYLRALESSAESTSQTRTATVYQFGFGRRLPSSSQYVQCGGFIFNQMPSFTLGNALKGTDDARGLQQLSSVFQMVDQQTLYDGYQELASGATFVLPHGSVVVTSPSGCTATVPYTPIKFTIERRQYTSADFSEPNALRAQFDSDTLLPSPVAWSVNPVWTSPPVFVPRWDSFAARRVNWTKPVDPTPDAPPTREAVFTTDAIKRGTFLGVAAHLPPGYLPDPFPQNCLQSPATQGCHELIQKLKDWGTSMIAVHLATFPIG